MRETVAPNGPKKTGHRVSPEASSSRAQLTRLLQLVLALQSTRFPNAKDLAETCEVSRRTVYRDLEMLAVAGVPVRYSVERQGYQLVKGFFLPPMGLDQAEVLALLVLSRQWEDGLSLGLLRHAKEGASKLVHGLNDESKARVLQSAALFEDRPQTTREGRRADVEAALISAITVGRQLRIWYDDPAGMTTECTKYSLYRILLHERRWYLIGRSSIRRRVEVIRLDSIQRISLTDEPSTVPPRFSLKRFLGFAWGIDRQPVRFQVWLRFDRELANEVAGQAWHPSQSLLALADGRVDLHFTVDGIDEMVRWILGYGDQVEVLAPPRLRARVAEVARAIVARHTGASGGLSDLTSERGRRTEPADG